MTWIYDITRTISPSLAVWPGDTPFSFRYILSQEAGDPVNLTTLDIGAHTGSHIDAPYHCNSAGEHPADLPLEQYIGTAHLVTIDRQYGGIVPEDFAGQKLAGMERLIIHTWAGDLPDERWPEDFPYPTLELAEWLAGRGVVLLGVDTPSVDRFGDDRLSCHHYLTSRGIAILETLTLSHVPDGIYELIALPLKIAGVCGSPVRAILRTAIEA
ncbi:MAG: cyclase family protein [Anaerolineae bacterium]|nr:cyclase family protein [Anaerolineae bacterium]